MWSRFLGQPKKKSLVVENAQYSANDYENNNDVCLCTCGNQVSGDGGSESTKRMKVVPYVNVEIIPGVIGASEQFSKTINYNNSKNNMEVDVLDNESEVANNKSTVEGSEESKIDLNKVSNPSLISQDKNTTTATSSNNNNTYNNNSINNNNNNSNNNNNNNSNINISDNNNNNINTDNTDNRTAVEEPKSNTRGRKNTSESNPSSPCLSSKGENTKSSTKGHSKSAKNQKRNSTDSNSHLTTAVTAPSPKSGSSPITVTKVKAKHLSKQGGTGKQDQIAAAKQVPSGDIVLLNHCPICCMCNMEETSLKGESYSYPIGGVIRSENHSRMNLAGSCITESHSNISFGESFLDANNPSVLNYVTGSNANVDGMSSMRPLSEINHNISNGYLNKHVHQGSSN